MIDSLLNEFQLRKVKLKGPTHQTQFFRYFWGEPSIPAVASSSLRSTAYLCHSSAVLVPGLTDHEPTIYYANYEQSVKPRPTGELTQASLDRAFGGKQRESTFAFHFVEYRVVLLSGKNTNLRNALPSLRYGTLLTVLPFISLMRLVAFS